MCQFWSKSKRPLLFKTCSLFNVPCLLSQETEELPNSIEEIIFKASFSIEYVFPSMISCYLKRLTQAYAADRLIISLLKIYIPMYNYSFIKTNNNSNSWRLHGNPCIKNLTWSHQKGEKPVLLLFDIPTCEEPPPPPPADNSNLDSQNQLLLLTNWEVFA